MKSELWRKIEESPPVNSAVIAWSGNGPRFMLKDAMGQWRNMMGTPKPEPLAWMPRPAKPSWLRRKGES